LLPMFRDWLAATYIPGQFPEYVRWICSASECELVAMAIGGMKWSQYGGCRKLT
jgi:hypothetical protein